MQPISILTGPLEVNTYIMHGAQTGACFLVDPAEAAPVRQAMEEYGLRPTHILLTHGHFDHILAVAELKKAYGAKVCIHALEAEALSDAQVNLSMVAGMQVPPCKADVLLTGGESVEAAGFAVKVIHTPGHSPGSVCYVLEHEGIIFSGDTLFRLSVGRTDFPGGNAQVLFDSISDKLFSLPGDYTVYPGHMRRTTLAFERQHNPFMRDWGMDQW